MSTRIIANEREFQSQVYVWLNEAIKAGGTPFEMAGGEAGVHATDERRKGTRFPDVQLWTNVAARQGFCWWELKTPKTPVDDSQLLKDALEKARSRNLRYFVTWNMREAVLWEVPLGTKEITSEYRRQFYPAIAVIRDVNDMVDASKREMLRARSHEILMDIARLHKDGHLHQVDVDATYFVQKLSDAVQNLYPVVDASLQKRVARDAKFRDELYAWAAKQAIANYADESFFQSVARQMVYRVLGKILFYVTLRRYFNALPVMDFSNVSPRDISVQLKKYFDHARQVDYQSIFNEDLPDEIDYGEQAAGVLAQLVSDLNRYNFSSVSQDVVGEVFERLIPPEERHLLGQYFTPENLVDLINAFCIKTANAHVLDPTCGTGTFLIRAYNKKHTEGERDHHNLLSQLWGVDVASFPSELATINLYRQNLQNYANFPRIISKDFFQVKPRDAFDFPPPNLDMKNPTLKMTEKMPAFDAIVGNFPYIRQELIDRRVKGYKATLDQVLGRSWIDVYSKGSDKKQILTGLSGQADIYAYLFIHSGTFLKEGGRMGIVTSNSWLDVGYGYELQKFFLNNFKIVAILESRCEPWFEDAAINTVVTVLERCSEADQRNNHLVKFVKIKRKLSELIPQDIRVDSMRRWQELDRMVHSIEHAGDKHLALSGSRVVCGLEGLDTVENDNFRIRLKKQGELLNEVERAGKTVKWGQYLRAPDVYYEILEKCRDRLVPLSEVAEIRRGFTTGINDFFYLNDEKIKHWKIEPEFLAPVIKSPREFKGINIDIKRLETKVFVCNKTKQDLRKEKKSGALSYIEWGEQQKTGDGVPWPEVPSVKNRNPGWWALPDTELAKIFWFKAYDAKLFEGFSKAPILADCRLYFVNPKKSGQGDIIGALLNSSLSALFLETIGRVSLGEGALDVMVEDVEEYMSIINPGYLDKKYSANLLESFEEISKRPIKSIFEETKLKDRIKFDSCVLAALGMDSREYAPKIYEGLCMLVRERLELSKMRKVVKKTKIKRDEGKIKKDVSEQVLPDGLRRFPDSFLPGGLKSGDFKDVSLPNTSLKLGQQMMIFYEVVAEDGFKYDAEGEPEARFLVHAQKRNQYIVRVPRKQLVAQKAVLAYEKYLKNTLEELFKEFYERTGDHALSDRLARLVLSDHGARVDLV